MSQLSRKGRSTKKGMFNILKMMALSAIFIFIFPWWVCMLCTAIVAVLQKQSAASSFGQGFAAISLLWLGLALFYSIPNLGMLADQVGKLIGGLSGIQLLQVSALLGGITGGLGAWSGTLLRNALK